MSVETILFSAFELVAKLAPGLLAMMTGQATDAEALSKARRDYEKLAPRAPVARERSRRRLAELAGAPTAADAVALRTLARSPSVGAAEPLLRAATLIDHVLEEERLERSDEPTTTTKVPT